MPPVTCHLLPVSFHLCHVNVTCHLSGTAKVLSTDTSLLTLTTMHRKMFLETPKKHFTEITFVEATCYLKANALRQKKKLRIFCCCICSLRLNVFLPPLPEVQCPIFLDFWNPWKKVMERSGLIFENFCS